MIHVLPLLLSVSAHTPIDFQQIDFSATTSLSFAQQHQPDVIQADPQESMEVLANDWGNKDTWRWNIQGGYGKDVKESNNTVKTIGVEFEYFIENALSLDLGFFGMGVNQEGPDANGLNFTLQLRWHFNDMGSWSMFMEGGAGLLRTTNHVPAGGSSFNFTPQAGLGMSFDIGNHNRWLIGVKWHHISNANTYDTNPGRDSWQVWTGISFPF